MSKSLKYLRKAGPERSAESDPRWQLDEKPEGAGDIHSSLSARRRNSSGTERTPRIADP